VELKISDKKEIRTLEGMIEFRKDRQKLIPHQAHHWDEQLIRLEKRLRELKHE
jgi:hypothetical protein